MNNRVTKKINVFYVLFVAFLFIFAFVPQNVFAANESIQNFNAEITVHNDSSVTVEETIEYNFSTNQRHGIFRDIPLTSKNGPRIVVKVSQVVDAFGKAYPYTTSQENGVLHIKIGDPKSVISGSHIYHIEYNVYNAVRSFASYDELYWNVTGDEWVVPIHNVVASVHFPEISNVYLQTECFTGRKGSTEQQCVILPQNESAQFIMLRTLNPREGITIAATVPSGYIEYPTFFQRLIHGQIALPYEVLFVIALPVIFLLSTYLSLLFFRKKMNIIKAKKGTIIAEYEPPKELRIFDMATLYDSKSGVNTLPSIIISLAIDGYLKIKYSAEKRRFFADKDDFEIIKLKKGEDLLHPADKAVYKILFENSDTVRVRDLKKEIAQIHSIFKKVKKDTVDQLYYSEYFDESSRGVMKKIQTILVLIVFGFYCVTFFHIKSFAFVAKLGLVASLCTGLLLGVFTAPHNKLTQKGIDIYRKILGFKKFLEVTEKDRLQFFNAPEKKPEIFEKFLPHAMIFGVEKQWAETFEGIYMEEPHWFVGNGTARTFNSTVFIGSLSVFNQTLGGAIATSVGGGGSSGGGSGGGGGGSW